MRVLAQSFTLGNDFFLCLQQPPKPATRSLKV